MTSNGKHLLLCNRQLTSGSHRRGRQDEEEHAADSAWKTVNGTENVRENSERKTCSVGETSEREERHTSSKRTR